MLFSVDVEDRQQLLERRVGRNHWNRPTHAFQRQMSALLDTLDTLECRATHFMLGVTVSHYPEIMQRIVSRGDEIGCHGFAHRRVHRQSRRDFELDLRRAIETVESLTGMRPVGYRAPRFSVNRDCLWMFESLAAHGFHYDASLNNTPRVPKRILGIPRAPVHLKLPSGRAIITVPAMCWHGLHRIAVPAGGGGYWRALPTSFVVRGIRASMSSQGVSAVYVHPYEFDPVPLASIRPEGGGIYPGPWLKSAFDNLWRHRVRQTTERLIREHHCMSYQSGLERYCMQTRLPVLSFTAQGRLRPSES